MTNAIGAGLGWLAICLSCSPGRTGPPVTGVAPAPAHVASYADPADYPQLVRLGIDTVLVELTADGSDWDPTYRAAARAGLRLIPLVWGDDQTAWAWNDRAGEWELDIRRYPESAGARFLQFLREDPARLRRTFALYSFHEPLDDPERTGPDRLKAFYRQITEQEFPGGELLVYGEDMTMGWPLSDACLTGVLDYESHGIYPFARAGASRYVLFEPEGDGEEDPTNDLEAVIRAELASLDRRLERYAAAEPAATGRRPRPIVLIQTFSSRQAEGKWNRMPTAAEMEAVASAVVRARGDRIAGLAWYPFRSPSSDYSATLQSDRRDPAGADRWAVLPVVGRLLRSQSTDTAPRP
jgi:hypothetical protein